MDENNTTLSFRTSTNSSQPPAAIKSTNLFVAMLLFAAFLVGVVGNGLYLWVLGLKIRRTVTTLWFFHLVSCSLLFTLLIPFIAIYIICNLHWVLGTAICKLLSVCTHLGMFCSVFLLSLISLDRYILTCHPIWSRQHRTMSLARKLVVSVWLASFVLSTPYLAYQETRKVEEGRVICTNYFPFRDQDGVETQTWKKHTHLVLFLVRFLLGFLLPFCIIAGCYIRMGLEMKEKGLARSRKPFKVMVAAVVSFFLGWLPYHLHYTLRLFKEDPKSFTGIFQVICIIMFCFNVCFTPVLYLFVGETFHQVFRTSVFALVKAAFYEDPDSDGPGSESSGRHREETSHKVDKNLEC